MPHLGSIQQLRAVAALAVMLYHALQWSGVELEALQAGVDLFFVISGFVMQVSTAGRPLSPRVFLRRRLARVAPLYWLVTLTAVVAASAAPALFPAIDWDLRRLALSLAFVMHADDAGQPFPVLPVGWSLCYEAVFYLIFAAALFAPEKMRLALLTLALGGLSTLGFMERPEALRPLDPFLLQFLAGAWIGEAWRKGLLPSAGAGFAILLLGFGAIAAMQIGGADIVAWRPFLWGPPAALVVIGAVAMEAGRQQLRWTPLERLGDASYSLYLTHPLVLSLIASGTALSGPALVLCGTAASIGAALICRVTLEKPLIALFSGRAPGRSGAPLPA